MSLMSKVIYEVSNLIKGMNMMSEEQARDILIDLANRYLSCDPELNSLLEIIKDKSRSGLPVRGVLESMKKYRTIEYLEQDKKDIEELLYLYG